MWCCHKNQSENHKKFLTYFGTVAIPHYFDNHLHGCAGGFSIATFEIADFEPRSIIVTPFSLNRHGF